MAVFTNRVNTAKPKVIYRMSGCEVVRCGDPALNPPFNLYHSGRFVAAFRSQRAAIRYLAREFVIPIQH